MRLFAFLLAAIFATSTAGVADNWKKVGSVTFLDPFLEQVIPIAAANGHLRAVRFDVKGADVEISSIHIHYGNGKSQEVKVRSIFKAGTSSRRIDLPGSSVLVKHIVVVYRAKGQATFDVVADVKEAPQWVQLGCKSVGFFADRDAIAANATDKNFSAIRLRVTQLPVEFYELTIVFGNDQRQTYRVNVKVPAGVTTNPIDLKGERRGIKRIEMLYSTAMRHKNTATVCVDGYRLPG